MTDSPHPPAATFTTDDAHLAWLARHSRDVIRTHQDPGGAYPAAPTFSAYQGYAWLRDGSFTAEAMSRAGEVDSADAFHSWVATVLGARGDQVAAVRAARAKGESLAAPDMLPTRFRLDGTDGTDPWWDFQTDGYGLWLWSLVTHAERHGLDLERWSAPVAATTDYLLATWDLPCYDWWEEHVEQRHTSTLGAIFAGLRAAGLSGALDADRAAAALATAEEIQVLVREHGTTRGRAADPGTPHLAKWFGSTAVDASLAACIVPFRLLEPGSSLAEATLDAVVVDLDAEGGVYRFRDDVFYGGGRWPLLSCLLGWNRAVTGDRAAALRYLRWAGAQADEAGELPEQVDGLLLAPDHRAGWVQRWGLVASPLLWSHAMLVILADELGLLEDLRP